jgi:hypothetical protein
MPVMLGVLNGPALAMKVIILPDPPQLAQPEG